ncbi:MAG: hypothetical protein AAFQ43_12880, partial [Bacteroidota bacterium]
MGVFAAAGGGVGLARTVGRVAVLDAPKLGYAERTGPVIDALLVVAMGSVVTALAGVVCIVAAATVLARATRTSTAGAALIAGASGALATIGGGVAPLAAGTALGLVGVGLSAILEGRRERWGWPLTFRGILLGVFVLSPLAYGFMAQPLGQRTDDLLADAARLFSGGRDDRVTYALDQVLAEARADDALRPVLLDAVAAADSLRRGLTPTPTPLSEATASPEVTALDSVLALASLDSTRQSLGDLARGLVQSSLLGSLSDVAAELRFVSPTGDTLGSYVEGGLPSVPADDPLAFDAMRDRYETRDESGFFVGSAPSPDRRGLPRYAGIGPLAETDTTESTQARAWIYVHVAPRPARFAAETPFPRVLAPADLFGIEDEAIAYAEYDDGVRARGGDEAPFRLAEAVYADLERGEGSTYQTEETDGETVRAYYTRIGDDVRDVVSARVASGDPLDVLLVLLRLTLAG